MESASIKKIDQSLFEERRSNIQNRRFGGDRRKSKDPNYKGPSRRMLLDRRLNIHDRRKGHQ